MNSDQLHHEIAKHVAEKAIFDAVIRQDWVATRLKLMQMIASDADQIFVEETMMNIARMDKVLNVTKYKP